MLEDQILAAVMTDKATVEIPSPVAGKVLALGGEVGSTLAVGAELVRLEVAGEGNAEVDAAPREAAPAASGHGIPLRVSAQVAMPPIMNRPGMLKLRNFSTPMLSVNATATIA